MSILARHDPEGGHMFIEEFILALFPTPKVPARMSTVRTGSHVKISNTFDHLRGRHIGNTLDYKHATPSGSKSEFFCQSLVNSIPVI